MSIIYKQVLDGGKILRGCAPQDDREWAATQDDSRTVLQSNAKSEGKDSSAAPQNDRGAAAPQNDRGAAAPQNDRGAAAPQNDMGEAAPQNDRGAAGKSEYQRAREHFRAQFAEKTAEELAAQRKRLAYAQAAIGDLRSPCTWLAHHRAVYFWAMAQSIELGEAIRRLQEKQRQEKQAVQQLRF